MDKDRGDIIDVETAKVVAVLNKGTAIEGLKLEKGEIKGSNGSLDRYTKIDSRGSIIDGKLGIVIVKALDDVGYVICDSNGAQSNIKKEDLIQVIERDSNKMLANGKIVDSGTGKYISSIYGTYDKEDLEKLKEKALANRKANKELANNTIKQLNKSGTFNNSARQVTMSGRQCSTDLIKQHDELSGMDVDQKYVYAEHVIKQVRPFYFYILMSLKKKWSLELETLGVTSDTLYMNPNFVLQISLPELVFIVMHEVMHVAMCHPYRRSNKDPECWGIAVDYFVNEHLIDEFRLPRNNEPVQILLKDGGVFNKTSSDINKYKIALPSSACVNPNVKLSTDTAESLYNELMNLKQQQQEQQNNGQGDSNQSGENSEGSSSSGGSGSQQNSQNQDSSQDSSQNCQGNQSGNNQGDQQGNESADGNENNNGNDSNGNGSGQPKDKDNNGNESNSGQNSNGNGDENSLDGKIFRGHKINSKNANDILKDSSEPVSKEQAKQLAQAVLARAVTLAKKNIPGWGTESVDPIERMILDTLAPKINWKTLLKNYLTFASQKVNTFAAPDKRFRSRGMIMPGPKQLENDSLENVKVCIDTSGSIGNKELGMAMNQIKQLLKVYKAKAELIYWDTKVAAVYDFKNVDELVKAIPKGGGGTDPNCIFEYFETNRDYKIGKKGKPSIVLIFTDGYFGELHDKYKKYKNTIWIINDGVSEFNPPFGKVAPFKVDDE